MFADFLRIVLKRLEDVQVSSQGSKSGGAIDLDLGEKILEDHVLVGTSVAKSVASLESDLQFHNLAIASPIIQKNLFALLQMV